MHSASMPNAIFILRIIFQSDFTFKDFFIWHF